MRTPSAREAENYDIVVWVDEEGDIVARGFSDTGHTALRRYVNEYQRGDIVQIYVPPKEFEADMPTDLTVGLLTRSGVRPMRSAHLH